MYLQSFCKELAKSNHKPRNPELCRRLQDPLSRDTIPKFLSTSSINDGGGKNEIEQMLKKKAIAPVQNEPQQSASYIFIVPKKSSGFRPVINLKNTNSFVEYNHFKMKSLLLLNELLEEGDYFCRLVLKDAYFDRSFYVSISV